MIEIIVLLISIDCLCLSCLVLSLCLWRNKVNNKLEAQKFIANNALEGMKHLRDVRFTELFALVHKMLVDIESLSKHYDRVDKQIGKRDPMLTHLLSQFKSFATRIGCGPDDPKPKVEHTDKHCELLSNLKGL